METNLDPVFTKREEKDKQIFTPKKYKVRSGTIDWGKEYEIKATALLALKCCAEELQHFWLAANVDGCGALDDIILYKKSEENDQGITYCMQLKHQEVSKKLIKDMFLSPKGDFSLKKYFECYRRVKSTIDDKTQKADDVIKHFRQVKKLVFIIFTNKGVIEDSPFLHKVNKVSHLDALGMEGDTFEFDHATFSEVNTNFLKTLYLFTNQPHIRNMENKIISAIKNLLHSLDVVVDLRDVTVKFVFFINEWSKGLLGGHYPITKTHIVKKLAELLLVPYMFKLQEPKDKKNDKEENAKGENKDDTEEENIWYTLTRDQDVAVIDEVDDVVQQFVNDYTYQILSNKKILEYKTPINKELLRVSSNPENLSNGDKYELLWKTRKIPLVLQVSDSQSVKDVQEILKAFPEVFRIIILNKTKDQLANLQTSTSFTNYITDLSEKHQEQILQCPVKLQGRELLIKELNIDKGQFFKALTVRDIAHILYGQFYIGSNFEPLPEFFVDMSLTRIILDITVLEKVKQDIFVVKCECFSNFKAFLLHQLALSENQMIEWKHFDKSNFAGKIITYNLAQNLYQIEEYCLTLGKTVHFLSWHGDGNLEWVKSNNTITNLRKYKKSWESTKMQSVLAKEAILHFCQNNKTLLVSADPGMGKTVLINYLAQHIPTDLWVLKINLAKHKDQYSNWDVQNFNSKELNYTKYFEHFLEDALKEQQTCNSTIFDMVFKQYLNSNDVVLLLDGFDEVPIECQEGLKELIKFINESGYCTCVTTRPVLKRDLESLLHSFAITIDTFTIDEQMYFLSNYFANVAKITALDKKVVSFVAKLLEATRNNLNDADNKFTGIPLQSTLLAEVFKKDFIQYLDDEIFKNQYFDLIYLYKHFLKEKVNIACTKVESVSEDTITQYKMCRSFYALRHLFSDGDIEELKIDDKLKTINEIFPHTMLLIQKDGIVVTDSKSHVSFVHQTYAEFLAAKWLVENLTTSHKAIVLKLIKKTFNSNFLIVRTMFDRLLAKNCPLHTAIINRQINTVKEIIISDKNACDTIDEGGRTILHLIAAWGFHYPDVTDDIQYYEYFRIGKRNRSDDDDDDNTSDDDDMFDDDDMTTILKLIPVNKLAHAEDLLNYTPLHYAVLNRSLRIANSICSKTKNPKCSINITDAEANHTLYYVNNRFSNSLYAFVVRCCIRTEFEEMLSQSGDRISDLNTAISKGNIENVRSLISKKNRNLKDHNGYTPLHVAANNGHAEITRYLLSKKVNINATDTTGRTALHWASYKGHLDIVSLLIAKGVKVSTTDRCNRTALNYTLLSSSPNRCDIASILIKKHLPKFPRKRKALNTVFKKAAKLLANNTNTANFIHIQDDDNMNALHWASYIGQTDITELLLSNKVDINAEGWNGATALHIAAENNHFDIIHLLLSNGANIEATASRNETALHLAAREGHNDVVSLLLTNRADIQAKTVSIETPLHLAAHEGHKDVVSVLLSNGADIESLNIKHETPLHVAARECSKDVVNLLLNNGAAIETIDKNNNTPLHVAARKGHKDVVSLLLDSGANIKATAWRNETPLHLAARKGHKDVVSLLLASGADIEAKNKSNETPLQVAARKDCREIITLLLSNGADIQAIDKNYNILFNLAEGERHSQLNFISGHFTSTVDK